MADIRTSAKRRQTRTQERLDRLLTEIQSASNQQIGCPTNQNFDYSPLLPFLKYSLNNVGDPFHDSNYWSNTHEMEREVIARFATLMRLDPDQAWGYVTSGGTESNLYERYQVGPQEHKDRRHLPAGPRATCTGSTWRGKCFPTGYSISPRKLTTASSRTCDY